jgi:hypothetical protein
MWLVNNILTYQLFFIKTRYNFTFCSQKRYNVLLNRRVYSVIYILKTVEI